MLNLRDVIGNIIGKGRKGKKASIDELRTLLKSRFLNFRTLLKANNEILEIMADMEITLRSGRSFGMSYIRANCTAIAVNLFKIVQNLNLISRNKYLDLPEIAERLWKSISEQIEARRKTAEGPAVTPFGKIDRTSSDLVGNKMANLGETRNHLGLNVPDGFVITSAAYEQFLSFSKLQEEINRRLQLLDGSDMELLHRTSSELQQLIVQAEIPRSLEREIMEAFDLLEGKDRKGLRISMRSSAIGEDSSHVSFAGQYRSSLNVSREFVLHTYKEIVASKYTLQAIIYRINRGFRDEDIPMCVGCMEMVDAVSGGVMYSRDPADFSRRTVLINAAWGLAKSVVDGSVSPDTFIVSRDNAGQKVEIIIGSKEKKVVSDEKEGVTSVILSEEERGRAALTEPEILNLAAVAEKLEDHFGMPHDIEWSIDGSGRIVILQARPLHKTKRHERDLEEEGEAHAGHTILLSGGVTVNGGAAAGEAFLVNSTLDMLRFPSGAILVAKYPFPQLASLLPYAAGAVIDYGGVTGHMATVAREFDVPAIFNMLNATERIRTGELITVDADGNRVFQGKVDSLISRRGKKEGLMEGSPVHTLLKDVLELITPLNLTDPDSIDFRPKNCRTVHDITRFCHEMSVREIFDFSQEHSFRRYPVKRLMTHVPTQWWVLNLDDGFREGVKGKHVKIQDITSVPMLAIWEGINAVKWEGPPPVDTKGFMSILYEATIDTELEPSMKSSYTDKNYLIIARDFCNVSSRFGFHFSTVEAYVSETPKDNYISFNFRGGAADFERKVRRVEFIGGILGQFGFRIEIHGDGMLARAEGFSREETIEKLKIMGYMLMHTRQIDMIMNNDTVVREYHANFIKDIETLIAKEKEKKEDEKK